MLYNTLVMILMNLYPISIISELVLLISSRFREYNGASDEFKSQHPQLHGIV